MKKLIIKHVNKLFGKRRELRERSLQVQLQSAGALDILIFVISKFIIIVCLLISWNTAYPASTTEISINNT